MSFREITEDYYEPLEAYLGEPLAVELADYDAVHEEEYPS